MSRLYDFLPSIHSATDPQRNSVLHATFVPNVTFDEDNSTLTVEVPDYVLRLRLRQYSVQFSNSFFGADGGMITEEGIPNCFYTGIVDQFPGWKASLSTCQGLEGSFGLMGDPENFYYIEPLATFNQSTQGTYFDELLQPHILYSDLLADDLDSNTYYGICDSSLTMEQERLILTQSSEDAMEAFEAVPSLRTKRIVELILVNDHTFYRRRRSRINSVLERNNQIIDYMNQLYEDFNISIVLTGVITWSKFDEITFPRNNDPTRILKTFRVYIKENSSPAPYDAVLMITGRDFLGNVVGLAYKKSMCYSSFAIGIIQDTKGGITYVGGTSCHELGHILGMSHDDSQARPCNCQDKTGKCIMAGLSLAIPATIWSNCSGYDMLQSFKKDRLTERCLFNVPKMTNASTLPVDVQNDADQEHFKITYMDLILYMSIFLCW